MRVPIHSNDGSGRSTNVYASPKIFALAEDDTNAVTQKLQFDTFKFKDHDLLIKPDLKTNNSSSPLVNSKDEINTVLLPEVSLIKKGGLIKREENSYPLDSRVFKVLSEFSNQY